MPLAGRRVCVLSQLPFGSVPFRHGGRLRLRGVPCPVSITFRLSALSAHDGPFKAVFKGGFKSQLPFGSVPFRHRSSSLAKSTARGGVSQLPFGSVPFRHRLRRPANTHGTELTGLNYLSAQCPFGTRRGPRSAAVPPYRGPITFRLRALSARVARRSRRSVGKSSQLPFGSVPFRHRCPCVPKIPLPRRCLNYLSAQCPFGTGSTRGGGERRLPPRLNYLSAQCPFGTCRGDNSYYVCHCRLNYLSAQCPFGTVCGGFPPLTEAEKSQLPFGSVPFRHGRFSVCEDCGEITLSQLPFGSVPFRHTRPT